MKENIYIVLGEQQCRIINEWETENFVLLKDKIRVYTFNTKEEKEAFIKGFNEAIGYSQYEVLNDNQIEYILEFQNND